MVLFALREDPFSSKGFLKGVAQECKECKGGQNRATASAPRLGGAKVEIGELKVLGFQHEQFSEGQRPQFSWSGIIAPFSC